MVLHRSPREYGINRTRWRLQDVRKAISWLGDCSDPGICKLLKRLGFSRKQALHFIQSPDPEFHVKWRAILRAFEDAAYHPETTVILFLDELTYYRRATKAPAYHRKGDDQPRVIGAAGANTQTRVVAVLNGLTGQVLHLQDYIIGKNALVSFYDQIGAAYPNIKKIYVVQDNWPTHRLPDVLAAMQANRVTPVFLPTYASWLNPIEKLWRWLKQDVLHNNPNAANLKELRAQVVEFLSRFNKNSDGLLRYTGLMSE